MSEQRHLGIFPADLGEQSPLTIGSLIVHRVEAVSYRDLDALIDAFLSVFEHAAERKERELDIFLAYVPLLASRIGQEAQLLQISGFPAEAETLRRSSFPLMELAALRAGVQA